jgi:hypothetical protein
MQITLLNPFHIGSLFLNCNCRALKRQVINARTVVKCAYTGQADNILTKCYEKNSIALVYKQTIPTEGPPLVGEVSANFCG